MDSWGRNRAARGAGGQHAQGKDCHVQGQLLARQALVKAPGRKGGVQTGDGGLEREPSNDGGFRWGKLQTVQ